jgi:hypothetical protein
LGDVGADLGLERFNAGELLFAAEFLDEGDLNVLAVKVTGEIEDVNFDEATGGGVLEGGTKADVDDGKALPDTGGIHAVGREDFVVKVQVCGRETDGGAAVVAGFDSAVQGKRAAEHGGGAVKACVKDVLADGRGTDHFTVSGVDDGNLGNGVAESRSVTFHERCVAGAVVSEVKTGADTNLADTMGGEFFEEGFGRRDGEFTGEWEDERDVHAELFDKREFVRRRGKQWRRFVGMEDAHWMRVEGKDSGCGSDDALVAEVDAIEDADGDVEGAIQRGEFGE